MDEPLRIPIEVDGAGRAASDFDAVRAALLAMAQASEQASGTSAVDRWAAYSTAVSSSVSNIRTAVAIFEGAAESIADLATEQERLTRNSARIGVDFDQAAAAAGRFADETTAMAAATRLFESGTRVSQEQLNALMRVAGEFSQTTGVSMEQAVSQLTQGLIAGSERGLRPFGAEMLAVAGHSHTTEERLTALVMHAGRVEAATDTAADRMERFKDSIGDQMRSAASTFVDRLVTINDRANDLNSTLGTTQSETAELGVTLTDVADGAARAFSAMASGIGFALVEVKNSVLDVVDGLRLAAQITARPMDAAAAVDAWTARAAGREAQNQSWANRVGAALEGDPESRMTDGPRSGAGASSGTGGRSAGGEHDASRAYAQQGHLQQAQLEKDRRATERTRRERGRHHRGSHQPTYEESLAEKEGFARQAIAAEEAAYEESRVEKEGLARQTTAATAARARNAFTRRPGGGGAPGDAVQDRANARIRAREQRELDQRADAMQTFTDRWVDMHHHQVDAAQEAAEGISAAFKGIGDALGEHIVAFAQGKEDIEDALQGVLSSTLGSLAKEAQAKGSFYAAEALGLLVAGNFPGAATAAAASAAYFVAAGGAAFAAAETKPNSDKSSAELKREGVIPSGRGGHGARNERLSPSVNAGSLGDDGPVVVNNFYAPVIGGRESTSYETGNRLGRFGDASTRRQVRERS